MQAKSVYPFVRLDALVLAIALVTYTALAADGFPNNVDDGEDELLAGSSGGSSLATWHVSEPHLNLWISSNPLSYVTSWGKTLGFQVAHKQRNTRVATNIFGLGPYWECSWLSYVMYKVSNGTNITVDTTYVPLGGERSYAPDGVTKEFKSSSTMTKRLVSRIRG